MLLMWQPPSLRLGQTLRAPWLGRAFPFGPDTWALAGLLQLPSQSERKSPAVATEWAGPGPWFPFQPRVASQSEMAACTFNKEREIGVLLIY